MATLGNATVNAFFLPGSNVARQHTIGPRRRLVAFVAQPHLFSHFALRSERDVVVAIGDLGNDGPADPGFGFCHQPLHFRRSDGERLALDLQLLAIIIIVFGGVHECARDVAISEICAARETAS